MSRSSLIITLAALAATCEAPHPIAPPSDMPSASERPTATDRDRPRPTVDVIGLDYGDHPAQTIDLYFPQPPPPEPIAVVVLAHGGLWQGGDKLALARLCMTLVESSRGALACASINYRLSHELDGVCRGAGVDAYVEQIRDLIGAYTRLQAEADARGFDPERIYVGGHSAGAQLAHTLNLRWSELAPACARAGGCVAPAGAIGIEGIYDVAAWDAYDARVWSGQFACATRKAFGGAPDSGTPCIDAQHRVPCWQLGSPTHLARHAAALGLAPVGHALIIHSPDDDWVDIAEASSFAAAMSAGFPDLHVIRSTDGGCGRGSHDAVLDDPALASCIVAFVSSAGASI